MGRRPQPDEMVILRKAMPLMPEGKWKVTARYTLRLTAKKTVSCVRVRGPYTPTYDGIVLHLSVDEFNRLFKASAQRQSYTVKK